jgi:hypothetical protein
MKKTLFGLLFMNIVLSPAFGAELSFKFSKDVSAKDKKILMQALNEVSGLLPEKMKALMPAGIELKVAKLSHHTSVPTNICLSTDKEEVKNTKKEKPFTYGLYRKMGNQLVINAPVLLELAIGRTKSPAINCQHKSLYDQSIATLIHELTHAYDLNNKRISNNSEYIRRAGFKKGLLKIKNKNLQAMRSADIYEMSNMAESFAVNVEYFLMDPEFFCRKPSMFNFFSKHFGIDPYPNRNCKVSDTVMVSTPHGFESAQLSLKRLYRVDYLVATPGKDASSGFGHSMFRLIMCAPERLDPISNTMIPATPYGPKCLEDKLFHLVISYRANIEDAKLNYLKGLGLMGAYPSMLFILNFGDVLDEYNRDELRDVMSYPLKLSAKEKEEFLLRTKEEHWNYRGAYKFITNNCAVESYDLLKSSIEDKSLESKSSLSPKGVLEDLDKLEYLSLTDGSIETYKAKTEQLVSAYQSAYGIKSKNDKEAKKAIQKFIDESTIEQRMAVFKRFSQSKSPSMDLNAELSFLKERLVKASAFSVLEQQIQRVAALKVRKKAAELFTNTKDPRVKEMVKEAGATFSQSLTSLTNAGYGIPFNDEMVTSAELGESSEAAVEVLARAENLLKELMPQDYKNLEKLDLSIRTFNQNSLTIRRDFRLKLDQYILQVLKNLAREEATRGILVSAAQNDLASLKRVRNLLGSDLVSEKELLDAKLKKIIQTIL